MRRTLDRRAFLGALGTASLAGCLGVGDSGGSNGPRSDADAAGNGSTTAEPTTPHPPTADETLPLPMAPATLRERAVSGGPPKDGIPSIDQPSFLSAADVPETLREGDPVFGVAMDGVAKAYPQSILVHHEICNDVVGDTPVSVTYCPLTGTAMGIYRGETTLGVSGRLVNNNLIMYARATERWWPQVLATAIPGPWYEDPVRASLSEFRVVWTTWGRWRDRHPETVVLSRDTGYIRNYSRDPYGSYNPRKSYYAPSSSPLFESFSSDDRLPPKAVVVGARTPDGAVAFDKEVLRSEELLAGQLDGTPVLAVYEPDLDTAYVYRNPDDVAFEYDDGRAVGPDGTAHPPEDLPLDRILAFDAMWFAWIGFYPESTVYV